MDKDILDDAKDDFKRSYDAESSQRKMSEECMTFGILGEQWPDEVKSQRENEGRPCLTINRMPTFQKQVTNDARLNRPSIRVKPVGNGADQVTARIQTDLIRSIWNVSKGDICADTAMDFASAGGFGYMRVAVDYTCDDIFDQDILLERVANPFTVFGDPDSTSATSEDWMRAFVTEFYSKSKFQSKGWKWSDIKPSGFESDGKEELWYEGEKVRVAEYWVRSEEKTELVKLSDGKIMQADEVEKIKDLLAVQEIGIVGTRPSKTYKVKQYLITGNEVLEENDWLGHYIPIVPMYGEEWNINGRRYFFGLFNRAMDSQRMFNYWRTASTELVALAPKAPYVGPVGAFATDANKWATANTKSHAYIEFDIVPQAGPASAPQRQAFAGVPAGALQEAMNASDDMKATMGLFDASMGAKSNETSGKAIMARQREGDTSTFNFTDNRNRCVEHVGKIILDLIPQVYSVPRIIRAIRDDGTSYDVPVNQPVTAQPPEKPGEVEKYTPAEQTIEGITQIFDLTVGKYDVSVDAGPSFTTRREEAAEQMMEFIRVYPQAAPLMGDLLAKSLDWQNSDEIAERFRSMIPPQAAGKVDPMVQQLQQVIQEGGKELQRLKQMLEDKRREDEIKEYDAETKRISALTAAAEKGIVLTRNANGDMQAMPILPPGPMNPQNPPDGGFSAFGNTPEQPLGM